MKLIIFCCLLIVSFQRISAQRGAMEPGPVPTGASQMSVLIDPNWKSNTAMAGLAWETHAGVTGSMFFNEDWAKGWVLLMDNRIARDVLLRYNVYTNQIYFKIDSEVRVIDPAIPVKEFGLEKSKEESGKFTVFRSGYPGSSRNAFNTFYELIAGGRISLLKHDTRRIVERNNLSTGPEKIFTDTETWFVYDSTGQKMTEIRRTKNALVDALPGYAQKIQAAIGEKGLRLKTDQDWVILFNELNK